MRNQAGGLRDRDRESKERDDCTVRVTNLSEDVTQADLNTLFSNCGRVQRVFVAKQR